MEEQGSIHPVVSWNLGEALVQVLMTQCEALGEPFEWQLSHHLTFLSHLRRTDGMWVVALRRKQTRAAECRATWSLSQTGSGAGTAVVCGCIIYLVYIFQIFFKFRKSTTSFFLSHSIIDAILRGTFLDGDMYVICWLRMLVEKPCQCQAVVS